MKVSERMLSTPQKVAQMQHYWDNLWHMTPDKDKKKNLERRFGIKNIKVDNRGKILSFEEIEDEAYGGTAKKKKMQKILKQKGYFHRKDRPAGWVENKVRSFEQFLEAKQKTVVFSFGRLNPPTIGHQKLLQKIVQTAKQQSGQPMMFVSYSQDAKKNPLTAKQKIAYIKKMFPKEARELKLKDDSSLRNAMDIATELHGNYDNLVMVVGSDRGRDFKTLLNK